MGVRKEENFTINLKQLGGLINPNKIKLLKLLKKGDKKNQLQLREKLGISYRQTRRHIDSLKKAGIINKKKIKRARGSPVMVSLRKK